ncbi:MAG TPA: hypothetical protein VLH35_01745, partial [Candidatus Acidoferrales bacterium]|nr:hypothetical protein [Candidatus Acidoferrales bacterium]
MSNSQTPPITKKSSSKKFLKYAVQIVCMVAIFVALLWYVGLESLYNALFTLKVEYLLLAFLMYFGINVFFAIRLQ